LNFAAAGGAGKTKMNIQHPTSNIQRPKRPAARHFRFIGCSALDVRSWMFFFFVVLIAAPRTFGQAANNALPPLAPPDGEIPPTFWQQHGTVILIGGFIFLALAAVVLWLILKPGTPPVLLPAVVARAALARLQRQPEDGKVLSEVSQILRRYVSAAFEFPAGELTTAEFSAALAGSERVGAELARTISSFLRECDERKFSPVNPEQPLNSVSRALDFVTQIQQQANQMKKGETT
jgi:hypothetical protein